MSESWKAFCARGDEGHWTYEDIRVWYWDAKKEIARLTAENERLRTAIVNFCKQSKLADDMWKEQPHIKVLFEIAEEDE